MSEPTAQQHWNRIYRDTGAESVSWYQPEPTMSLRLLQTARLAAGRSVVDVGGGASVLVDRLLQAGLTDVTVVDVASWALQISRDRLGPAGAGVRWLVRDVLTWQPERRLDLWHDRAVYHFLTDPADRAAYRRTMHTALDTDGTAVIGTFAAGGPPSCSGLPVNRYSPDELAAEFPGLHLSATEREDHHTPAGGIQGFTWVNLTRQR